MTPENAERALYSDILNLSVALEEYKQFKGVLDKITKVYEIKDLLSDALSSLDVRINLIDKICSKEHYTGLNERLKSLQPAELSNSLIQGVLLERKSLTAYLSDERYALRPLHNFFFTRDAAVSIYDRVLISSMANSVREREALLMQTIFKYSSHIKAPTLCYADGTQHTVSFEGGDVLVARDDIMIIGNSTRTTSRGIDFIIEQLKTRASKQHIVVQQLPGSPESFIHLDMVFTLLDKDECMIYEPLILKNSNFQTILITIDNGEVVDISNQENLLSCLSALGMDLKPVLCGGSQDLWSQEREQWHSGANFLSLAPGKIIGYARNTHTIEELSKNKYEIIPADKIIEGTLNIDDYAKCVVTIDGSELARGGGGARCMSMPVNREPVIW